MKITSPKRHASHSTANAEALQKCQSALEKRDRGDYESAREVMRPSWKRIGDRPAVTALHASISAAALICVGTLPSSIGSTEHPEDPQELATNLITAGL